MSLYFLAAMALFATLNAVSGADETNQRGPVKMAATAGGVRFASLRDLPAKPLPTVFFFGGPAATSLTEPQFLEAEKALGPDVLCVTLDAPAEGERRGPGEPLSLAAWRLRVDRGEDIILDLTTRAKAVLEHLIACHATDPARVAVFGTSRGGFMAFHFAAVEPRIGCIAAFAPVTDLRALVEFSGVTNRQAIRAAEVSRLANRQIYVVIGNNDQRVGTARALEFTKGIIEAAEALRQKPAIELHVVPAEGHRVPDGTYGAGARWLLNQWHLK